MKKQEQPIKKQEVKVGKTISGIVVSMKTKQTIQVKVERFIVHPIYKKPVRRSRIFAAHNEIEGISEGDTVRIISTKPISKTKHFKVLEKVTL